LIYGDSVFLEGIAETLRLRDDLQVMILKPPADPSILAVLHPDLMLVDALQITPNQMESLLSTFPVDRCPPILRVNAGKKQMIAVSAQQFPADSLNDLTYLLEKLLHQQETVSLRNEADKQTPLQSPFKKAPLH
jgi:hypothetical protein